MLRTSLRSVRALGGRRIAPAVGRQWLVPEARRVVVNEAQRSYSDDKKPEAELPKPAAIPTLETNTSPTTPGALETAAATPIIPQDDVPLVPPPPPLEKPRVENVYQAAVPRRRSLLARLERFVLTVFLLGAVSFGGGVWWARKNDYFHDLFTEYIPYGEQAVLFLEEKEWRNRFPDTSNRVTSRIADGESVRIPAHSGASWRVADQGELGGRSSSAVSKAAVKVKEALTPKEDLPRVKGAEKETAKLPVTEAPGQPVPVPGSSNDTAPASVSAPAPASPTTLVPAPATKAYKAPEVDEPSRWPPAAPIDPLAVNDATEPVVQELVRMLNDIIAVVNADGANEKYGPTIGKAKDKVNMVGRQVREMKEAVEREAAKQVRARVDDFERSATKLVSQVEAAMTAQEIQWRREFEEEMVRMRAGYEDKVQTFAERERQLNEERTRNRLLEQAMALQRDFKKQVRAQVEEEREARLGKLGELRKSVSELEKLAGGLNVVVDASLRTQQLHVAVEAVKAALEDPRQPRPFVKELVALRETVADDVEVVSAAIASMPPTAYQRGVASHAELVERFRRVAGEVRKASLLPEDAGVASHASSWALSKVMFRKSPGLAAVDGGDDVESILARTQTSLEDGNLDKAAREMNGLTGWAKVLSRDWLAEVRKVLEVRQALEVIETEARLQGLKLE